MELKTPNMKDSLFIFHKDKANILIQKLSLKAAWLARTLHKESLYFLPSIKAQAASSAPGMF
jgi:hypothetical protein